MNHITIAGHLGADPVTRFTSAGKKVTSFRVATRKRRKGKDETIWWGVVIFGEQFDKLIPHFKKGSPIIVMGEIDEVQKFTDREGNPQASVNIIATEIHFSPFGRPDRPQQEGGEASPSQGFAEVVYGAGKQETSFDDEVPF